jgi:hypothetical protein
MKAKSCVLMALAAGTACSAFGTEPVLETASKVQIQGYIYINARTGERVVTPANVNRAGPGVFVNEDSASNGNFFWGMDNPTATFPTTVGGGARIGGEASDWGDMAFDMFIDGYTTAYACNVGSGSSIPGFTLINWWFDCDNGFGDTAAVPVQGVGLSSIAGGNPTLTGGLFAGWVYTVDLAGTGIEFELGDTDGSYVGATGLDSTGCDKDDTDGNPLNDFSWSYIFDQSGTGLALGTAGPFLVLPQYAALNEDDIFVPTGSTAVDTFGIEDVFDLYKAPNGFLREQYAASLFFGGWVPGGTTPYSSFYMGLYGGGGTDPCALADYNGDGGVDILDFLDFFDDYSNCDGQAGPCGNFGNADVNGDGGVDILDFLDFFDVYSQCS